jgi:multidrug efflux pump subunit AcrB
MILIFSKLLKSELAPLEDHSVLRASITLPEGADFDYTNALVDKISQQMLDSIPETRLTFHKDRWWWRRRCIQYKSGKHKFISYRT